jgi:F-type H+-transporting ATPase subunit delta
VAERESAAARRYAAAALDQARAEGAVEIWLQTIEAAARLVVQPDLRVALASPRLPTATKLSLLSHALEAAGVPAPRGSLRRLIALLIERGRSSELGSVAAAFRALADTRAGRVRAEVTSALPLSDQDREALRNGLARALGEAARGGVVLEERVDPQLLAGLTVRVGDRISDASARTRLERMRSLLAGAQ